MGEYKELRQNARLGKNKRRPTINRITEWRIRKLNERRVARAVSRDESNRKLGTLMRIVTNEK